MSGTYRPDSQAGELRSVALCIMMEAADSPAASHLYAAASGLLQVAERLEGEELR